MSTEKTEYVVQNDGVILRRLIREYTVNADNNLAQSLITGMAIKIKNAAMVNGTPVHLSVTAEEVCYWTVRLNALPFRVPMRVSSGGIMTPDFGAGTNAPNTIIVDASWVPPESMRLVLLVATNHGGQLTTWLYAISPAARYYKLPAPNLYDDCRVCLGDFYPDGAKCQVDYLNAVCEQFAKSQWNSDLWRNNPNTEPMFRFKPGTEGSAITTLPPLAEWTTLCAKVATGTIERVIL
jgi:hypothetical protein